MSYKLRREDTKGGGVRYVVYWDNGRNGQLDTFEIGTSRGYGGAWIYDLDPHNHSPELEPWKRPLGYMYSDTFGLVAEALTALVRERAEYKAKQIADFNHWVRTCTDRVHWDICVDLSPSETFAALTAPECRLYEEERRWGKMCGAEIMHGGRWLKLCRTDLKDDVATSSSISGTVDEVVAHYRNCIQFGARVTDTYFAVVDSLSDG